ncbi:MAG: radical SAM protein [Eubacteriales bacterium]|nr:radical SAM protein [Eubacteriales bacterium]
MLTIIVKGTNGCNLACSYCSLGKKDDFKFVNRETLEYIFDWSCSYAKQKNENTINFILHGGEPTLIRTETYQAAINSIKMNYPELNVTISMQSNGVAITDEFLQFIIRNDMRMGISIDGTAEIHDLERRTFDGKESYQRVIKNIERMRQAGVDVSCLMVLTKNAVGKGYDYLNFFGQKHIHLKINPLLNYGEAYEHPELCLESGEYAEYLISVYQYLIEKDIPATVSPIDDIIRAIVNKQRIGECSFNPDCSSHFLCIDYVGDIYPCGKFSDMNKFKLGNIKDNIVDESILQTLNDRRGSKSPVACRKCEYLWLCNCGCSAEACIDGDFFAEPKLCKDYKMLFDYFSKDGLILLRKELIRQKRILEEKR